MICEINFPLYTKLPSRIQLLR